MIFKDAYLNSSGNARGALWMIASAITFTVMTMLIKMLGEDYPAALQAFYRQLAGMAVLLPMILRDPRGSFRTTRPGVLLFRALAGRADSVGRDVARPVARARLCHRVARLSDAALGLHGRNRRCSPLAPIAPGLKEP